MAFWHCCMCVVLLHCDLAFFLFRISFFVFLFDWFLCFFGLFIMLFIVEKYWFYLCFVMKCVDWNWFLWILWFYIWVFYSLNEKLLSVLRLLLEWESLMSGGWGAVDKCFKPLMERRCPKIERWITEFPSSMVFSIDE